jgi:hypothetical protein
MGLVEADEVGIADALGAGVENATPLLQTNFLPDLTQVYLMFATVFVEFSFEHEVPAIVADCAGLDTKINKKAVLNPINLFRFANIF